LTYSNLPGGTTRIFIRDSNDCRLTLPVDVPEGVILDGVLSSRLECPDWDYTDPENPMLRNEERYFVAFEPSDDSETVAVTYTLTGINGTADPASNTGTNLEYEVPPGQYEGTGNASDPNEYEITVTGGNNGNPSSYQYFFVLLRNGQNVNQLNESDWEALPGNIFLIRETADYGFRVIDSSDCEVLFQTKLTYINIRIPNYFTPNRDDPSTPDDDERFWYPRQVLINVPGGGGNPGGNPGGPGGDPNKKDGMVFTKENRFLLEIIGIQ